MQEYSYAQQREERRFPQEPRTFHLPRRINRWDEMA